DQHATHRRGSGFLAMQFVKLVDLLLGANRLAELEGDEPANDPVAANEGNQERGRGRGDSAKRDVLKNIESLPEISAAAIGEFVQVEHHARSRPSTMRSI